MMVYQAWVTSMPHSMQIGIFSTVEKAKAACEKEAMRPLRWTGPQDGWEWHTAGGSHRIRGVEVD